MIKVIVSNNVERKTLIVPADKTIDAVIEESGVAMGSARPYLDGEPVHDKTHMTLQALGAGETAYLTAVANKDNN
jgi:hypothetical protein